MPDTREIQKIMQLQNLAGFEKFSKRTIAEELERQKLIELLADSEYMSFEKKADYLIANGVTIPVRCKECRHYECLGYVDDPDDEWYECSLGILNKKRHNKNSDAFCSYGERRVGDGKNCVFLPTQPRRCERIASGDKTDEIRKNSPKIPVPFKCYIYQSKGMWSYPILRSIGLNDLVEKLESGKGKVIGEFICDRIEQICVDNDKRLSKTSCVSLEEMWKYAAPKSAFDLKAWHISALKIYDKPKQLSEFGLSRAPQSWCYVEEV